MTRVLTAVTLFVALSCRSGAQEPDSVNSFELRPGVIIDAARRQGYFMSPDGGIDAVDLANGKLVWNTKDADKPLGIAGELLIGQAESSDAPNRMKVVALEAAIGQQVLTGTRELAANVKASVTETLNGEFVVRARSSEGDAVVSWQYFERPITGIPPNEEEPPAPELAAEKDEDHERRVSDESLLRGHDPSRREAGRDARPTSCTGPLG
jgi:hypothetical protein